MRPYWSQRVIDDLDAIQTYVANAILPRLEKIALRLIEFVETMIGENPGIGRPGRVPGTRELVVPRTAYIVPYRVLHGTIEVVRVYHGARRWPERL